MTDDTQAPEQEATAAQKLQYRAEKGRIRLRRECLGLNPGQAPGKHWALALSGGGIRSATFSLGVLQAMARAPAPSSRGTLAAEDTGRRLLPHFDYLSTVSGGGYIGSFFGSLFMPGRLSNTVREEGDDGVCAKSVRDAGKLAYQVLDFEPPGRIHSNKAYEFTHNPGEGPMAWLRENGRYLLPSGSGDLVYAVALSLRNFLAVHFVLGMPLLFLLALSVLGQDLLANSSLCAADGLLSHERVARLACQSLWGLPLLSFFALVVPLILAFWMVYAQESQDERARVLNVSLVLHVLAAGGFAALGYYLPQSRATSWLCWFLASMVGVGILTQLAMILPILSSKEDRPDGITTVRSFRILATRRLSKMLALTAVLFFLALVTDTAQFVYEQFFRKDPFVGATPPLVLGGLIVVIRQITKVLDGKSLPSWFEKLPIEVVAGAVGAAMLFSLAVMWGMAVEWIRWNGLGPGGRPTDLSLLRVGGLVVVALVLTAMSGQFIGFLNLSSLHAFYASRLARAYLGASNQARFNTFRTPVAHKPRADKQLKSVADALVGDDVLLEKYYGTQTCAPVHLINVTLNLTVDPGEQLVQRERKGKPLCLAPNFYPREHDMDVVSYILDGEPRIRSSRHKWFSEITQPLTLSHWVATSGAAVTTGLGRATSLGTSLALGLANVRLGSWWPCNFIDGTEGKHDQRLWKDKWLVRALPTQAYLFYELTATFHGYRRDFQYLSDGGHFENTAAYELLRKGRDIELIVLCDGGCDQAYAFDDVANLVRLARIDHALEIEEDLAIQQHPVLGKVFFSMGEFADRSKLAPQQCAVMLDVFEKDQHKTLRCKILILKPSVIRALPADVQNYANSNPMFPQQSTADQSFDEAQFESYRQVGLNIGQLLFGQAKDSEPDIAGALWTYLEQDLAGKRQQLSSSDMRY